jgi:hypothetical protein
MKHYVGEVGTSIVLDTGIALAGATVIQIKYLKPDGTTGYWSASIVDSTKVSYTLAANNIDQAGTWAFQSYVEVSGGKWTGETTQIAFSAAFDQSYLTDLNAVKLMIGLTAAQTDDDELLEGLIDKETKFIQTATGRTLFYGTFTEYKNGDGLDSVMVDEYPIVAVTTLHDDVDRVYGADTLVASTDFTIRANAGIIELDDDIFSVGKQNVKIVYTGGYKVVPADLALACAQRVVADYLELKGGMSAVVGEVVTYKPANLRSEAGKVIKLYRNNAK